MSTPGQYYFETGPVTRSDIARLEAKLDRILDILEHPTADERPQPVIASGENWQELGEPEGFTPNADGQASTP